MKMFERSHKSKVQDLNRALDIIGLKLVMPSPANGFNYALQLAHGPGHLIESSRHGIAKTVSFKWIDDIYDLVLGVGTDAQAQSFIVDGYQMRLKNPFSMCQSIEEALIKIDLLEKEKQDASNNDLEAACIHS